MSLRVNAQIRVNRTGTATWNVTFNGVEIATFTSAEDAERLGFGLVSNAAVADRGLATKTAAVEIKTLTPTNYDGTDSFAVKLTTTGQETIPFVRGTNAAAADVQAALRTLTGVSGLTASGTTDEGPFTVTYVGSTVRQIPLAQGTVSGCTLVVATTTTGGVG